jgi:putative protein-disulfide isomerase
MTNVLYYVHDPMCSWCYGFTPALERLVPSLPEQTSIVRLLGGLAPDSNEPMAPEMRLHLQQTWHRIQHRIPGTVFNFGFWTLCEPRRSTWPACRAVIAARRQDPAFDEAMTRAVQRAYYAEARNPSDASVLIELAGEIGADTDLFGQRLAAAETQAELQEEMARARSMGADSFPALVLEQNHRRWRIPVDYTDPSPMLRAIQEVLPVTAT